MSIAQASVAIHPSDQVKGSSVQTVQHKVNAALAVPAHKKISGLAATASSPAVITDSRGGDGGDPFDDILDIGTQGVTRPSTITLAGERFVDAIQFAYNAPDSTSTARNGNRHGGNGGNKLAPFALDADDSIVRVTGRSARYVDQVRFHTRKGRQYGIGGGGGDPFDLSHAGYTLGWISGRSADYVDRLTLNWIPQSVVKYSLSNVTYDLGSANITNIGQPSVAVEAPGVNSSDLPQTTSAQYTVQYTSESNWSMTNGFTIGVAVEAWAGVPQVVGGQVTVSTAYNFSYTSGGSYSKSESKTATLQVTIPPRSRMIARMLVQDGQCTVNFTADVTTHFADGSSQTAKQQVGSYTGVALTNISTQFDAPTPI